MLPINRHPSNSPMLQTKTHVRVISLPGHCPCGTDYNTVLADFLDDYAIYGDIILIETYYPPPQDTSDTAASSEGASDITPSKETSIDLSFLDIFQVRGITAFIS